MQHIQYNKIIQMLMYHYFLLFALGLLGKFQYRITTRQRLTHIRDILVGFAHKMGRKLRRLYAVVGSIPAIYLDRK